MTHPSSPFAVVTPSEVHDSYAGTDVPGAFRSLTAALGAEQLGISLIEIPPHSDFEQGTGHHHKEIEELYIVTSGTLTMRFDDEVRQLVPRRSPGSRRPRTARTATRVTSP